MSEDLPLILLPGLMCDEVSWASTAEELACEWQVLDIPAYDTIPAIAEELLGQLPDRFAFAGHSMGGYIGLEILNQAPDRVDRIAFVASMAQPDGPDMVQARARLVERVEAGEFDEIAVTLSKMMVPKTQEDASWYREQFVEMAHRIGPEKFVAHQKAVMARTDRHDTAKAYGGPCLVIGSEEDAITPMTMMEKLSKAAAGSTLIRLPDGGHLIPWTKPFEVATALDGWLSR